MEKMEKTEKTEKTETVLVDTFEVPAASRAELRERAEVNQAFVRTLPGFVEGWLYERDGEGDGAAVITVAVWASREDFERAKEAVAARARAAGADPQAFLRERGIVMRRGLFSRRPY